MANNDPLPYLKEQIGQLPTSGDPRVTLNYYLRVIKALIGGGGTDADNLFLDLSSVGTVITLTQLQLDSRNIYLSGTLTENKTLEFLNLNRTWNVIDTTTRDGFTISVKKTGGASTLLSAGKAISVYATGT